MSRSLCNNSIPGLILCWIGTITFLTRTLIRSFGCIRANISFVTRHVKLHLKEFETFERQLYFGDGVCGPSSTCLGGHTCYTLLVHKGYSCADLKQFECPCYRCYCPAPEDGLYAAHPNTDTDFCTMVRDRPKLMLRCGCNLLFIRNFCPPSNVKNNLNAILMYQQLC